MAIAAIVIHTSPENLEAAKASLQERPEIVEASIVPPAKIAAALETPVQTLQSSLEAIQALSWVWNLDLAYVNYEDDLEQSGQIACPDAEIKTGQEM